MPEGVDYGPQFTASTGLSLNYVGNFAYAYSGAVTVDGSDIVALDFTTGSEVIDAKIMAQYMQASADSDDSVIIIKLNGLQVGGNLVGTNHGEPKPTMGPENWIPMLIPPYTRLQVLFTMLSGGGSIVLGVTLTGNVYE